MGELFYWALPFFVLFHFHESAEGCTLTTVYEPRSIFAISYWSF